MNRSRILALVGAAVVALFVLAGSAASANPPGSVDAKPPAVYLVPHQDDETLSMSADIRVHINAGRPIEVYLYTNGSHTRVCGDRFGFNLEPAECTAARDAEFDHATMLLGVPAEHVHRVVDPATGERPDDYPTVDAARRMLAWVMADVEARYPSFDRHEISYKSMSWADNHPGHAVMGQALREAWQADGRVDARFFLKRDPHGEWPTRPDGAASKSVTSTVSKGGRSWYRIRAASFSYGIGNLSVSREFRYLRADPRSIVHDVTR